MRMRRGALLDVLGHDAGDSVGWNGRLQFAWCDRDEKWVIMQSGMGKVASGFDVSDDHRQVSGRYIFLSLDLRVVW